MRTNWLITTAAAAILASTGLAVGQGMNERGGKSGAMEKSAPSAQSQGQNQGGQMQRQQQPSGSAQKQEPRAGADQQQQKQRRTGADDRGKQRMGADDDQKKQQRTGADDRGKQQRMGADDDKKQQRRMGADDDKKKQQRMGADDDKKQRGAQQKGKETTGRGDASGTSLTSEQRTRIRKVVVSKNIPKVEKVNFNVSVGVTVPRTVNFHPIPAEIVEIYPAWRGYRVILVGTELVIIDPSSYRIVAVIVV
jgi:hypothetical protein